MTRASPVMRRLMAIGLLIVAAAAAYGLLVDPILTRFRENAESIAQSRDLLTRYQRLAAEATAYQAALAEAPPDAPLSSSDYLRSASDTLAASELQTLMRKILDAHGGALRSASVLPVREDGGYRGVGLRFQIAADMSALPAILHDLEFSKPVLFIDNMDVVGIERGPRPDDGPSDSLSIYFDLYGYLPPAPTQGPA